MPTVPPDPYHYLNARSTGMGYALNRHTIPNLKWIKAAKLLVEEPDLSDSAVALQVGVAVVTLRKWRHTAKFQQIVEKYTERLQAVVFNAGIGRKVHRVRQLNNQVNKMDRIMDQRAEEFRDAHAQACLEWEEGGRVGPEPRMPAGADTGLVAHRRVGAGTGTQAEVNDVYEFDSALQKSYLLTLEQAEKEMHALENPEEIKGGVSDSRPGVTIVFPVATPEQLEATENAQVIDMPPQMRRLMARRDGMPT